MRAFTTLVPALRMVFPAGAPACQRAAASLLTALVRAGPPFLAPVAEALSGLPDAVSGNAEIGAVMAELANAGM